MLTIAVPKYMDDINSIEDLKGKGKDFGGEIIGIEPGAGLTAATEKMIPEYGLDDEYKLVTSSTAAMLTELGNATDAEEDIVVTLWRPFWANNAYPVKDLEDPEGAMGEAEKLHFTATKRFSDEYGDAADYISKIKFDDKQYGDLGETSSSTNTRTRAKGHHRVAQGTRTPIPRVAHRRREVVRALGTQF